MENDEIVVTDAMRLAVHREECVQHGHDFDVIIEVMHDDPTALICRTCGRTWPVVPRDRP